MSEPYFYYAQLNRIVDGDTIDVTMDMGFKTFCKQRLRLLDYDAPERNEPGFQEAKEALTQVLTEASQLLVHTIKPDSFGRWLAMVWADDTDVTDFMRFWLDQEGYLRKKL